MTSDGLTMRTESLEAQLELLRRVLPNIKKNSSPMKIPSNEEETFQLLISAIEYIEFLNSALEN